MHRAAAHPNEPPLLLKGEPFADLFHCLMNLSLISRFRRAGAPLLFVAALCFGVACDHDAPEPAPIGPEPVNEQWQPAAVGRYEGRVRYSCDCRDEAQLVLIAAPTVADTLRTPAVRRTIYVDKRELPGANFAQGRTLAFRIREFRIVRNYHALELYHDDSLEFVCRVQPLGD